MQSKNRRNYHHQESGKDQHKNVSKLRKLFAGQNAIFALILGCRFMRSTHFEVMFTIFCPSVFFIWAMKESERLT